MAARHDQLAKPLLERFLDKVQMEPMSGCWLWAAKSCGNGYGHFWFKNKTVLAHRFSYELHFGEIGDGLQVCHGCDTPQCVNPAHLFLGTQKENIGDMITKGRAPHGDRHYTRKRPGSTMRGELNGVSKLSESKVLEIRERHSGGEHIRKLAREFCVSQRTVQRVVRGLGWKHVKGAA